MRLLLKIQTDDGYDMVLPFLGETKERAIEELQAAYNKTNDALVEFKIMYAGVCKRRDELYLERKQYGVGNEPKELMDELRAELQKTDLRNYNRPSEKVEFAGLDLSLGDFSTNHDGHVGVYMPEILTVDEFFADVE